MKRKNGFTLLELLVVIGIIAILLGFAAVSFSAAQKKSRDARRKEDLKAVQNTLEQYYAAEGFVYPGAVCSEATGYIQGSWPDDPVEGKVYYESCSGDAYCVCALLEAEGTGNSTGENCSWGSGTGADYYCVSNLQ